MARVAHDADVGRIKPARVIDPLKRDNVVNIGARRYATLSRADATKRAICEDHQAELTPVLAEPSGCAAKAIGAGEAGACRASRGEAGRRSTQARGRGSKPLHSLRTTKPGSLPAPGATMPSVLIANI